MMMKTINHPIKFMVYSVLKGRYVIKKVGEE